MNGITAKRFSVSDPKTAISRGQALPAAIRQIIKSADSPSAAIPDTVIIGDRGHSHQAANPVAQKTSSVITSLNNSSKLPVDDQRPHSPNYQVTRAQSC